MGSHWSCWKVKSSLCALAVSNGGSRQGGKIYPPGVNPEYLSSYSSFAPAMTWALSLVYIAHKAVYRVSLCPLTSFRLWDQAGRVRFTPPGVNLKIWAHLLFHALLHRRSFRIIYKRRNECFPIYLLGNTINVCWNPHNSAGFSETIDLRGHMPRFTQKMNIFPSI